MGNFYIIENKKNSSKIEINEIVLLKCIKSLKHRNPRLSDELITIWEQLEKKEFKKKEIEYL